MSRVEFLATICGTLLAVVLILHFGKPKDSASQMSSRGVPKEITSDATTIPESRFDSANVIGSGNTNENLEQTTSTNRTRVTNDSTKEGMAEMRAAPPRKQRIQIPPNTRWLPTNAATRPTSPGVRIAYP